MENDPWCVMVLCRDKAIISVLRCIVVDALQLVSSKLVFVMMTSDRTAIIVLKKILYIQNLLSEQEFNLYNPTAPEDFMKEICKYQNLLNGVEF